MAANDYTSPPSEVIESQPIDIVAAIEGMKVHQADAGKALFSQSVGSLPITQSQEASTIPITQAPEKKPEFITQEFILKLEEDAKSCAQNLSHLLGTLQAAMNAITTLSLQQMQAYQMSIDNLNESIGFSIIAANELIDKVQLLHQQLQPIDTLSGQVRDIKKNLDVLESLVGHVLKPSLAPPSTAK